MKCKMLLIAAAVLALCSLSFGQSQLFGISDYGYQLTLGDGVTPVPDGTTIYVFRTPDAAVSCPGSDGSGDQQPRTFAEDGNIVDRVSYNQWPLNGAGSLGFDGTFDYADVGYIVSGGGSAFSSPATFYVVIPYGDGSNAWVSPAGTLSASALPQDFDYSTESDWQRSQNCWTFAPPVLGRCCYGDPSAPSCAVVPESQCQTLAGAWLANETCETAPCPVVTPVGRCCYGDPFAPS